MQGHGWVTRFYKAFEATLNQCLGQPSAVFLDPQLDGGSELAPALRQIVCASAVLVPIVSPGYLNSPKYCGEEVNSFREQAKLQGRWSVGNSVLAVRKVVIQPLENDYHNQYPVDEPGYWFFEIDPVTKKSRKFEVGSDGIPQQVEPARGRHREISDDAPGAASVKIDLDISEGRKCDEEGNPARLRRVWLRWSRKGETRVLRRSRSTG